jgi:hypothetical protein
MELLLTRKTKDNLTTIGELNIDGVFECYTLEDKDRGLLQTMPLAEIMQIKIPTLTAIPAGRYEVAINFSDRFNRLMPILINVPGYAGVRIHWGNYAKNTDGCILVGKTESADFIGSSILEFTGFYLKLADALKTQKVFITIQ